jgi:hypothetical protein
MSHRVNVMLDDTVWQQFQAVPAGERSRLVNEALANQFLHQRRLDAMARMDEIRAKMPALPGTSEEWIREDRNTHE